MDPSAARAILEGVFTLAGATIAASVIAAVIQVAKGIPRVGPLLDAGREYIANLVLSAGLVGYAAFATGYAIDPVSAFGLLLAWLGLVGLAGKAYDAAHAAKVTVVGAGSSGGASGPAPA